MLFQIVNGTVAYGANEVLTNINFEIRNTEKIAVVGRNGCGKSTLLKVITGQLGLVKKNGEKSSVAKATGASVGYLQQMTFDDTSITLREEIRKVFEPALKIKQQMDELLAQIEQNADEKLIERYTALEQRFRFMDGYLIDKSYNTIIRRFGFSQQDENKKLSEFSGGQQTKISFIKLLLSKPDILLLDEPTNHLDLQTIRWLEQYIKTYPRAVVIVSHDRMFLDNVVDEVYEIERGKCKKYVGNYSDFEVKKAEDYERQKREYEAQQKEIERIGAVVERFRYKATKASMAQSKLKQLEHMELVDDPDKADTKQFFSTLTPMFESGNDVLTVDNLTVGYDSTHPLCTLSLEIKKGERVGIVGSNGTGKSTFLKTLCGKLPKLSGRFEYGFRVDMGYFDQHMAHNFTGKSVLDDFWDDFPELTQTQARSILGSFLFSGEDVFKSTADLSGGERVRLALAKLMQRKPNLIVLDEPTNHMDIVGKDALCSMLKNFTGTIIFVTHDRWLLKEVASSIVEFSGNGVEKFPYGYEQYEDAHPIENDDLSAMPKITGSKPLDSKKQSGKGKEIYLQRKQEQKNRARQNKLNSLINDAEQKLEKLNTQLNSPEIAADYIELSQIQEEIDALELEILEYTQEYEELCL